MELKLRKIVAIIAATSMLISGAAVGAYAAGDVDYTITNTYADVDWATYSQYKADLHSHTTASDGDITRQESIEKHYQLGYDILAISDHGTVDYGWDKADTAKVVNFAMTVKEGYRPLGEISASGSTLDGKSYTYTDNHYYKQTDNGVAGHTMMRVDFSNENNSTSFNNAHVNSWFVDYGNDTVGGTSDYMTPITNVDKLGGLSVINHPGEYTGARDESCFEDAYDMNSIRYKYVVNKFANLLDNNHSCIGIDINSKGDYRTRFDRKLWDILLARMIPTGRNVFAIATSDAHNLNIINSGYTIALMPELTNAALRDCLETGAFFAGSRYIGSRAETETWSNELNAANVAPELADALAEVTAKIYAEEAVGEQDTVYQFPENAKAPKVTGVSVDDNEDTITISAEDAYLVHWVADGKYIATGNTIDLDDYSDSIGSYVRAEIIGEGGVLYSQAFALDYEGAPKAKESFFVDIGYACTIGDYIVKALALFLRYSGIIDLVMPLIKK